LNYSTELGKERERKKQSEKERESDDVGLN
jgi:hypothetical protein